MQAFMGFPFFILYCKHIWIITTTKNTKQKKKYLKKILHPLKKKVFEDEISLEI